MATYVMALKGEGNELNNKIWNTQAQTFSEAKSYFVRLKNLPEKEFDKMFMVTEVKEKPAQVERRIFERNPDTGQIRSRKFGEYGKEVYHKPDDSIDIPGHEWVDEDED